MKEIEDFTKDEIVKVSDVKLEDKKLEHFGSITLHPGQVVWDLDLSSGKINLAEFEAEPINYINYELVKDVLIPNIRKIIIKEFHYYTCAINKRNAKRKFSKMLGL